MPSAATTGRVHFIELCPGVLVLFASVVACGGNSSIGESTSRTGARSITFARGVDVIKADANTWPTYQSSATHNAVFPDHKLNAAWNVQFDDKINGGLALAGGVLFTGNFDHAVYALDLESGQMLWATRTDNVVMSTPVVSHGIVVVGTGHDGWLDPSAPDPANQIWGRPEGDSIIALSVKDGRLLWRFHTVGDDMASPAVVGNELVFANGDLHVYALDLRSGHLLWRARLPGVASMDSTSIDRGFAFIGTCRAAPHNCETTAVDVRNGSIYWRNPIGSADAAPAIANGTVFTNTLTLEEPRRYNQGLR